MWLFKFNTRSSWDPVHRYIQDRKFYATLPHKLDAAEEDYLRLVEDSLKPEWEWVTTETEDGETLLGGEMRTTWTPKNDSNPE